MDTTIFFNSFFVHENYALSICTLHCYEYWVCKELWSMELLLSFFLSLYQEEEQSLTPLINGPSCLCFAWLLMSNCKTLLDWQVSGFDMIIHYHRIEWTICLSNAATQLHFGWLLSDIVHKHETQHTAWMSIWMTKRQAITTDAFQAG